MNSDELRQALQEPRGDRDRDRFRRSPFAGDRVSNLHVKNAMLIPDEPDHLVKVTDGKHVFIIDASRVVWLSIG